MDPATQGLLGAIAAQSVLKANDKVKLWLIALAAAMSPDLDVLIRSSNNPLLFIYYHRHFSHALAFIPIGGLLVGGFFLLIMRSLRPHWRWVLLASTIGYATHGLLDTCTSYGTVLLWPFTNNRYALDIISIIDPIFTLILLVFVGLSAVFAKRRYAIVGLLLGLVYLGFGAWQHNRALTLQKKLAASRHQSAEKARVTPTLGNVIRWRSLYISGDMIYLDSLTVPLWGENAVHPGSQLPRYQFSDLPPAIQKNPQLANDFAIFSWFADGYLTTFGEQPLVLADVRYLVTRKPPLVALWAIEFPQSTNRQHIIWRRMIEKRTS